MTISERLNNNSFELAGFFSSSTLSTIVFAEFLEKAVEVAIFALITGLVGAFGAHLYKLVINKFSKSQK